MKQNITTKNFIKNPLTGKYIVKGGTIYKKLIKNKKLSGEELFNYDKPEYAKNSKAYNKEMVAEETVLE